MNNEFKRELNSKLILSIIAAGLLSFTGVVVETSMNVTFPTLMKEFGISTSAVQWVTTGYLLVLAIVIPTSSFLKKRYTTKKLFLIAISLFILGIILDAVSPSFYILLMGRLIQGIGTGIALPLMFNIVLEQAPFEKMGLLMGLASLITAMAPAIGPSLGGLIVNNFGWRTIFIVLLPLLFCSLIIGSFSIRQVSEITHFSFDWQAYAFLVIGFSSFIFATSFAGELGWLNMEIVVLFAISIFGIILFLKRSKNSENPIINQEVFKNLGFSFQLLVLLLLQFICLGLGFIIPNYSQIVSGENAFVAGCLLLPGCFIGAFLPPFTGKLLDQKGAKIPILIGIGSITVSVLLFSIFATELSTPMFIGFYIFFAIGQGFTIGNIMTNSLRQLDEKLKGDGNAVLNTLQQLSGAIGTSIVSAVVAISQGVYSSDLGRGTLIGSKNAFYMLLGLGFVTILFSLAGLKRSKK